MYCATPGNTTTATKSAQINDVPNNNNNIK